MYIYIYIYIIYICMYVCMHACMHACMCVYIYTHIYMCIYIYIYVYDVGPCANGCVVSAPRARAARPISVLKFWISEGLTQARS